MNSSISTALIEQFNHRIYTESIPRIIKVMTLLDQDQIWYTPNSHSNSIGHLILHLCGNVTQWIGSGIGDRSDDRMRGLEFTTTTKYESADLEDRLWQLRDITDTALMGLKDEDLNKLEEVQGFKESILSILVHVIEHFSYHTGQIAIIAKYLEGKDLGFFEGLDLSVTSE